MTSRESRKSLKSEARESEKRYRSRPGRPTWWLPFNFYRSRRTSFLLLLTAILIPASGVLWFMSEAMKNERLAVQQRLRNAYRSQLQSAGKHLNDYWADHDLDLSFTEDLSPGEIFARLVRTGQVESVVVLDSSGRTAYPATSAPEGMRVGSSFFADAWKLEFVDSNWSEAAREYGRLAEESPDFNLQALALAGQARNYVKLEQIDLAFGLLLGPLSSPRLSAARDDLGNRISLNAQLLALQLLKDRSDSRWNRLWIELSEAVNDYSDSTLSGRQRLFLMEELVSIQPESQANGQPIFDTHEAERLAARYLDETFRHPREPGIHSTRVPGLWAAASRDFRTVELLSTDRVRTESLSQIEAEFSLEDLTLNLVPPGEPFPPSSLVESAGARLPGWQVSLQQTESVDLPWVARNRISLYLGLGILVVALITGLDLLVGRYFRNQMRLTRLRNDLTATVSHELKTPLASMRALLDTLLEGRVPDPSKEREYLELIATENSRLSRLIENFLTFSRLERNKGNFKFRVVNVEEVMRDAMDALREQIEQPETHFELKASPNLPSVNGDPQALTTVLVNLLENASKYSHSPREIVLRAYASSREVCLAVQDNGIGLSRREASKIFDRFHQVDQSLSRSGNGCGLGLSIVDFIVKAHGGNVTVDSNPGEGSTFTVHLPVQRV